VIGTLAVDGCAVTFGTTRRVLGGLSPLLAVPNVTAHPSTASVQTSYYLMWRYNCLWTLKGYTTAMRLCKVSFFLRVCSSTSDDFFWLEKVINVMYGEEGIYRIDEMDVAKTTTGVRRKERRAVRFTPSGWLQPISSLYMAVVSTDERRLRIMTVGMAVGRAVRRVLSTSSSCRSPRRLQRQRNGMPDHLITDGTAS